MRALVLAGCLPGLLGASLWARQATGQSQAGATPEKTAVRSPAGPQPRRKSVDELMGELLTSDEPDDDLAWLYSDEDYEPSDLTGKPLPVPALPERGEGSPRTWDPRWRRFTTGNYVLTITAWGFAMGGILLPVVPGRWSHSNEFDERVHRTLSIEDYPKGQWARDLSDLLLSTTVTFPLLFDSLIVAYWYRTSPDVAGQTALITTETLGVAAALQSMTSAITNRARPYVRNCGDLLPENLEDCNGRKPYRSFFSGHTTLSFAAAGVTCALHAQHDLFGDSAADAVACAANLLSAGTVGMMRIVGDQHFASDVLVGAGVGLAAGFGVPYLLHYAPSGSADENSVAVSLVPTSNGIGVGGTF